MGILLIRIYSYRLIYIYIYIHSYIFIYIYMRPGSVTLRRRQKNAAVASAPGECTRRVFFVGVRAWPNGGVRAGFHVSGRHHPLGDRFPEKWSKSSQTQKHTRSRMFGLFLRVLCFPNRAWAFTQHRPRYSKIENNGQTVCVANIETKFVFCDLVGTCSFQKKNCGHKVSIGILPT